MFVLLLVLGFNNVNAQDDNNPWQITVGFNAVDLYPVSEPAPLGPYFDEFFNVNDHWNIVPVLSKFTVSKYLGEGFSFGVGGSVNLIDRVGDTPTSGLSYIAANGIIKYNVGDAIGWEKLEPYLGVGGSYTWVEKIGAGTLDGSFGLNYWFSEQWGLTAQSTYKHSFEDYLPKHFQHTLGVSLRFGGKDTDGDGIYDKDDECPEVAGLEAFNGCPDSDGDGIKDGDDACPNDAGTAEHDGCPDSDGDGVADPNDNCPNTPGLASLSGCPDADGDGIRDGDDQCPNEAGPSANNGCPWKDSDGDGVLDKDDQCPNEAGTVANNGCPEVNPTEEVMETLNNYARTILFDTGRSSFKDETMPVLAAMVAIFKEYPNADFTIEGHTDSVGSESSNQLLSDRRANAVRDHLIANGISADRLSAVGLGEAQPIDSNKTRSGRSNNRRVEVTLKN
jgi:outer membrane protein OmpA-like peptidoglycan-associated protein